MTTGKIVLSVVAGVAAGAVLGILFAPDKGFNTRKRIVKSGKDLKDGVEDRFDRLRNFISEKFESTKDFAKDLTDHGRSGMHDIKKEAKTATS